jgi:hypothetical protein
LGKCICVCCKRWGRAPASATAVALAVPVAGGGTKAHHWQAVNYYYNSR